MVFFTHEAMVRKNCHSRRVTFHQLDQDVNQKVIPPIVCCVYANVSYNENNVGSALKEGIYKGFQWHIMLDSGHQTFCGLTF